VDLVGHLHIVEENFRCDGDKIIGIWENYRVGIFTVHTIQKNIITFIKEWDWTEIYSTLFLQLRRMRSLDLCTSHSFRILFRPSLPGIYLLVCCSFISTRLTQTRITELQNRKSELFCLMVKSYNLIQAQAMTLSVLPGTTTTLRSNWGWGPTARSGYEQR
jgi:hypothetical protein